MEYIKAIFENEEVNSFLEENEELVSNITESVENFAEYLKNFIAENAVEFIEPSVEDTRKNIRVFSEVAIAQYIKEQTNIYGKNLADNHVRQIMENSIDSYI